MADFVERKTRERLQKLLPTAAVQSHERQRRCVSNIVFEYQVS